ncbi:SPFH domain / Band 7 family protein [Poriferisphaera corsica]|uniref:SPFH domain / Band 7 family protein n=1 Tax=Poriferisphaera corsica TaxID=2528020 RepID=A0A517YY60_9BACT|nr:SPFH domain-containing protein [Poriferisphaera corsica]QDU35145.1 SPFH domain / Band 7 family protein [Poriferisphaera corsica]
MIWKKLRGELIDIIEWLDDSNDTMVYRFERYGNEIKYGAQLVVREGQYAVFVNQGKIADVFSPGQYRLETKNLPVLSTLMGWKYGFESPFKAEVYFVSSRRFTDLKWGTKNPIMMRDAEFGPIRIRAYGTYVMRVDKPDVFLKEIVGTDGEFTKDEIDGQLRSIVASRFADVVGEAKIPVLDMAANYDEFGQFLTDRIQSEFDTYGLELTKLLIENISLPSAVEEALDKRTSMGVIGNLDAYTKFQTAEAMEAAANNPNGGGAAEGMGLGMGFGMAQQMMGSMQQPSGGGQNVQGGQGGNQVGGPPPLPGVSALAVHVAVNGQQAGPFDEAALKGMISQGTLAAETLVWMGGMSGWQKAGEVGEVAKLFGQAPPPLPPMS